MVKYEIKLNYIHILGIREIKIFCYQKQFAENSVDVIYYIFLVYDIHKLFANTGYNYRCILQSELYYQLHVK